VAPAAKAITNEARTRGRSELPFYSLAALSSVAAE
jgi:hypothetical protein